MQKKKNDLIIGVFILIAIVIAAGLIIRFGGVRRPGRYYKVIVFFSTVSGLIEDAPVHYAGYECGAVDEIRPPTDVFPKVRVILRIKENIIIREQDTVTIASMNLLGDRIVKIVPGDFSAPPVKSGLPIEGKDPLDIGAIITPGLQEDFRDIMSGLADLVNEQNRGLFSRTIQNLYLASDGMVEDINNLRGIFNEETVQSMQRIINNLDKASSALPELTEQLAGFVDKNTGDIEGLIVSLKKSSDDISGFISSLRGITQAIARGEGTIGKLIHTSELYDNLNALAEGIRLYGLLGFQERLYEEELEKRKQREIWER